VLIDHGVQPGSEQRLELGEELVEGRDAEGFDAGIHGFIAHRSRLAIPQAKQREAAPDIGVVAIPLHKGQEQGPKQGTEVQRAVAARTQAGFPRIIGQGRNRVADHVRDGRQVVGRRGGGSRYHRNNSVRGCGVLSIRSRGVGGSIDTASYVLPPYLLELMPL
jgi:hypothetical protein